MSQTWESAQLRGRLVVSAKPGGGTNPALARPDLSNRSEQNYLRAAAPEVYASPGFAGPLPFSNLPRRH